MSSTPVPSSCCTVVAIFDFVVAVCSALQSRVPVVANHLQLLPEGPESATSDLLSGNKLAVLEVENVK